MEPVSEIQEEVGLFSTGIVYMCGILSVIKSKVVEWTIMVSVRVVSYCAHKISHLNFFLCDLCKRFAFKCAAPTLFHKLDNEKIILQPLRDR